ncbi:MAG TPA: transporter substrate-binding domain-containing protein [Thermoanaerobaculia bacterium]|nr:transporter substrate-binding domain-containing protein [Thermoanaerobaculia bacterium]HQR65988.1 transporter substrate-binding domain-containing protein [Thermoanaerobaculia bacterium]
MKRAAPAVGSVLAAALILLCPPGRASAVPQKTAKQVHSAPAQAVDERGGDFDVLKKRRVIRVLVAYNRTNYFIDKGVQRGITYEAFRLFEEEINRKYKTGNLKIHVVFRPVERKDLEAALLDGRGDVAAASITVTPERLQRADFSLPTGTNVSEIVVGGPSSEPVATAEDLSGREVFVRKGSIFHESVEKLNAALAAKGKAPAKLRFAPDDLEDEDLLEMVNAGLVRYVVVDDYLARFWAGVLPGLKLNAGAVLRATGDIAWAIRKNSPLLKAELDAFLKKHPEGSATRNVLFQKYLKSTKFVKNAASDAERKRFLEIIQYFKQYGEKYDVDYLLMAAQGFQESQLNQGAKSHVGAIGIMQVMPATGKELNVGDISKLEPNIHAGVKYMRFMIDQYFGNEPMDRLNKALFAFAAYNAGPNRIQSLRKEAAKQGLDPNKWFYNVELVVSKRIGRETVTYVANIYKYYVAYKLITEEDEERRRAKETVKGSS